MRSVNWAGPGLESRDRRGILNDLSLAHNATIEPRKNKLTINYKQMDVVEETQPTIQCASAQKIAPRFNHTAPRVLIGCGKAIHLPCFGEMSLRSVTPSYIEPSGKEVMKGHTRPIAGR